MHNSASIAEFTDNYADIPSCDPLSYMETYLERIPSKCYVMVVTFYLQLSTDSAIFSLHHTDCAEHRC